MKTKVVINEQHSLLPNQVEILDSKFQINGWELFKIPAEGLTLAAQIATAGRIQENPGVVFASPVPVLLARCVALAVEADSLGGGLRGSIWILHNDHREKKELPGGKVIMTVAQTGWQLVQI